MMNHMIFNYITIFAFLAINTNALSEQFPFRVIDEWGDSGISISMKVDEGLNLFNIKSPHGEFSFSSKHSFGGAFLAGSKNDHFLWLFPAQEMGNQYAAYISLKEKFAYVINLEKMLKNHKFIPASRVITGRKAISESWNISEWSFSEQKISIQCRLNPNEMGSGLIFYDHSKRNLHVVDLRGNIHNPEVIYSLEDPKLDLEKVTIQDPRQNAQTLEGTKAIER